MAKILVVEDDGMMREYVAILLRNAGYEVQTAEDGVAGGMAVLQDRPDLIVCDVKMPRLNGFNFIAAMRNLNVPDVPIIFLTSHEQGEDKGKDLGAIGYLSKPIHADALLSLVASALPAAESSAA